MQTNSIQLVWQCEYDMVMLNGQGVLHQVINPESLFGSLALRAVSVSAAIIAIAYRTTVFAYFFVAAKGSRAALGYFAQHLLLQRAEFCLRSQSGTEPFYHISQFIFWPHFLG
jgi:hypothetical protein